MADLTDEQCDDFRRLPGSFNDMVRAIYRAGRESTPTPPADAALAVALDCAAMGIRQHNEELADTLNKAAAALRARQEVAVPDGVAKDAMLIYEKALVKLATLGNEPLLGNSSGNVIAQDALAQAAAILAAKENKP